MDKNSHIHGLSKSFCTTKVKTIGIKTIYNLQELFYSMEAMVIILLIFTTFNIFTTFYIIQ